MQTTDLLGLEGTLVAVTGAASGIGLATARALRSVGATPLLLDIDPGGLASAQHLVFPDVRRDGAPLSYRVDQRDAGAVDACFDAIRRDHGPVSHAIANAAIAGGAGILDITDDQWRGILDVNLNGTFHVCRAAARHLAERRAGALVLMASIAGLRAKPGRIAYSASKAAVLGMTRALALDLGAMGVRVNALAPGVIETPIQRINDAAALRSTRERTALQRLGTPEDVARSALFLLSDLASYVTGEVLVVDGGLTVRYQ